jgi:hypothetical protein
MDAGHREAEYANWRRAVEMTFGWRVDRTANSSE